MQSPFFLALEHGRIVGLHERAASEAAAAAQLATLIANFVLDQLTHVPESCASACGFDDASAAEIASATGFSRAMVAAAFTGAIVQLGSWGGADRVRFLITQGVPPDDARAFCRSVELVCHKLGARASSFVTSACPQPEPQLA